MGLAPAAHAADYTPGSWPATPLLPEPDRHLVSRFSYALTPALAQQVRAAGGARAWFDDQLATAYDGSADNLADWWPHLHLGPTALWQLQVSGTRAGYRVMYDYGRRLLVRRLVSPRPVLEVMTEFWENYLNVPANGDSQFTWRARYGDVIRKHALGRFDEMLQDAIVHPAMLIYLDGANSTDDHPSENLARELLELHTVGVGAFKERDVKAAARILTGYRIEDRGDWTSSYDRSAHATGKVRVLGFSDANKRRDGRRVTRKFLRYLARHPKTARRIAHRLAVTFVSDDPPAPWSTTWRRSTDPTARPSGRCWRRWSPRPSSPPLRGARSATPARTWSPPSPCWAPSCPGPVRTTPLRRASSSTWPRPSASAPWRGPSRTARRSSAAPGRHRLA